MAAFMRHAKVTLAGRISCINTTKLFGRYQTCILNSTPACHRQLHMDWHCHSACKTKNRDLLRNLGLQTKLLARNPVLLGVTQARWKSSEAAVSDATATAAQNVPSATEGVQYIPDPPPIPSPSEFVEHLNALGEPTLQSLGLGGWSPIGLLQLGLEQLHCLGLPWWGAIVTGTIIIRVCMFPLVILAQKNMANLHNHMPTVQRLQNRVSESRMAGDPLDAAKAAREMGDFMKRNKINPLKNFAVPLAQVPVFASVFIGMRRMANLPVESMKDGGIMWFTDLTVTDPYYALPIMTCATLWVTLELGVDGVRAETMTHAVKSIMRIMPFIVFPIIVNFPAAMLCYWFTSNVFSLSQVMFLRIPAVREFFNIPKLVKHPPEALPPKRGFVEGFRESMTNANVVQRVEERQRLDAKRFREAGQGPIKKTYSYDPTKVKQISAKPK